MDKPKQLLPVANGRFGVWFANSTFNPCDQSLASLDSVMRALTLFLGFAVMSVAMSGCSSRLRVTLFNDSGGSVMLRLGGATMSVDPNGSAEFFYPGPDEDWALRVQRGACEYVYQVPRDLKDVPLAAQPSDQIPGGLKVQLERDLGVALLPATAKTVMPIDGLAELQRVGFPLRSSSVTCH